jgi:hypothetical protein
LRPVLEIKSGQVCDKVIAGYLQVIQALLEMAPDEVRLKAGRQETKDSNGFNLVALIFDFVCKLPQKKSVDGHTKVQEDVPKLKSRITRKRAFKLLLTLAQGCVDNYTQLLERLFVFYD